SSRRRHTRSKRDWSSDVCSSDLVKPGKIKFLSKTKNLSLQETIEQSYEETSSLEELLKVFLSSNEVKKLLKDEKVQAVYESGRKSEITDAIVHYIKHIFVTEFKKVDFTQENWVEKIGRAH